jgi:hypothetical protein
LQSTNQVDKCTNNIAKYEAILLGHRKIRANGVHTCTPGTYLKVVASQIENKCIARESTLKSHLALIGRMENYFKGFMMEYIEMKEAKILKPMS